MNPSKTIRLALCLSVFAMIVFSWQRAFTYPYGSGGGYSNAPGESNCTSCHFGTSLTTSASLISIKLNGSTTLKYKTDSTYTVSITATKSGISTWGFLTTVLKDSTNTYIGTLGVTTSDVQTTTYTVSSKSRTYVEQTSGGTSGSGSRTWSFSWKAPKTNVGAITFYVCVNAADGNGLESNDVIYANKFSLSYQSSNTPVAGFTFSPGLPCEGDTVSFKDSSTLSPTSWSWTFPGGTPSTSTLQNPKVKFAWGGHKVSLVASNKFGASATYSKAVNVLQRPTDTVYRSGATTFCDGDSLLLTGDFSADTYLWSTGETNQSVHVRKPGNYYVIAKNGSCSQKSQIVTVKTLPKPSINLVRTVNNDTICAGDTAKFVLSTSGKTYKYYVNGKLVAGSTGLSLAVPNLTGTTNKIFALAIDSLGCPSDTSKIYKVVVRTRLAAPTGSAVSSTTNTVTIKWNAVAGAKGYGISADSGKTWKTASGTLTHTENGLPSNTYIAMKVRAIDAAPCKNGGIGSILINTLPCSQTTFKVKADSFICSKSVANVTFSKISAPHYGIILNGLAKKDTAYSFHPTKDTIVHFDMIDSLKANCGTFGVDVPLKVIVLPGTFHISADKKGYCGNTEPAIIVATGKFDEYDFYMHDSLVQKDTSRIYVTNYFTDGERIVLKGKIHGCPSDSSQPLILRKYLQPEAGFTAIPGFEREMSFSNTSVNETKFTWYFGDSTIDTTSANPVHTYKNDKIYTVSLVVIGDGGCQDSTSQDLPVKLVHSGIQTVLNPGTLVIQPNPFNNLLNISFYGNNSAHLHLSITDNRGRVVKDFGVMRLVKGNNEIKIIVDSLQPGSYILKLDDGLQVVSRQLIKY